MTNESPHILFQDRDADIVRVIDQLGAATAQHLLAASRAWTIPFHDLHTLRRRLRRLTDAGWIRSFPLATHLPDARHYYRLTRSGFRMVHPDTAMPDDAVFRAVADSRQRHAFALADVLTHVIVACFLHRVRIPVFRREDEVTLEAGGFAVSPDHFLQVESSGKIFNFFVEIDRGTESIESDASNSIRNKLAAYEAYQDLALRQWNFRFRVAVLTTGIERVHNILVAAHRLCRAPERRICYAATFDAFLAEADAMRAPLFLDHRGRFQSLVDIHPTSNYLRSPVRLNHAMAPPLPV